MIWTSFCKLSFHSLLIFWDFINMVHLHTWPLCFCKVKNVELEVELLGHRLFTALILLALVLLFSKVLVPIYIHTSNSSTWLRICAFGFINFCPSDKCEVLSHWSLVCITFVYLWHGASSLSSSVTFSSCIISLFFTALLLFSLWFSLTSVYTPDSLPITWVAYVSSKFVSHLSLC